MPSAKKKSGPKKRIDYVGLNRTFTDSGKNREVRSNLQYLKNMVSPSKRKNDGSIAPPNTEDRGSIGNSSMQADQGLAEAAGAPSGSGDSTNIGFEYIHKPHNANSRLITYRNTIMANSWGYAYTKIDFNGAGNNWEEVMTPLAVIPVNQLSLYMSPAEYEKLPAQAKAISCRVKITPKGFRTSFATLQNAATYSNSNHTIFGVHAIGLNKSQFGGHLEIAERNAQEPMVVTKRNDVAADSMKNILWGLKTTDDNFLIDFPNCIGVKRSLPIYWNLHVYKKGHQQRNQAEYGWPQLREDVTEWDFAGHVNHQLIDYNYTFQHGIIKSRKGFWAYNEVNKDPGTI